VHIVVTSVINNNMLQYASQPRRDMPVFRQNLRMCESYV